MNLMEDIRSIEDVVSAPRDVLSEVHRTGRPMIIAVDGHADLIVIPAEKLRTWMPAMQNAVELATTDS